MRPEPGSLNAALSALLTQHPDALVGAINFEGLFVAVPESLSLGEHRVSRAQSALDLVQPRDRERVMAAWERVKEEGAAWVRVAVAGDGGGEASFHCFDVRTFHGVFVGVLVGSGLASDELDRVAEIAATPPRIVRTRKNEMSVILEADEDLRRMLGWDRAEYVGQRSLEFIHPDDHDLAINTWMEVLGKPGDTCRARLRHKHRDGRWVWLEIVNRNLLHQPDGYVDCEMYDISEEMEAHEAVRASEQLLRRLAGALPVGVAQFDRQRRLVYANDRLRDIIGAGPGFDDQEIFAGVVDRDEFDIAISTVLAGEDVDLELRIDPIDHSGRRHCTLALRALTDADEKVTGALGCLTDVTESSRMRVELEQRATFDHLTGCVNRATAMATLEDALGASDTHTAVIFVDLDGFKVVNDQFGHAVGDALLVEMAARFGDAVRDGDVVGRIGGDEFVMICSRVADAGAALALGDRIADAVAAPLDLDGLVLQPRASIGVAWAEAGDSSGDAEALIAQADAAMYASKAAGDGRPVLVGTSTRPGIAGNGGHHPSASTIFPTAASTPPLPAATGSR